MIFSGHSRSLRLLRSSSDDSLVTSQDAEATQTERRYTSPQPDNISRKTMTWFASDAFQKEPPTAEASMRSEWPNGPPPSGPKSHRAAISPPSIRRFSNRNEHVRRLSDHDARPSFTRQSFSSSMQWRRNDALPTVSRRFENGSQETAAHISISAGDIGKTTPDAEIRLPVDTVTNFTDSVDNGQSTKSTLPREVLWIDGPNDNKSSVVVRDGQAQSDSFSTYLDVTERLHLERLGKVSSLTQLSPPQPTQQIAHLDETASVVSDLTMSSGAAACGRSSITSGTRTRTCHKCKKPALEISPLFRCAECPRRYHSHCAVPRIPSSSQASGALDWICKHCMKTSQEIEISPGGPDLTPQNLMDKSDLPRARSPVGQSQTKAGTAASLACSCGAHNLDTEAIQRRLTYAEAPSNGHRQASTDCKSSQVLRNSRNHKVPSNMEQLDGSAFHLNHRIPMATAVTGEAVGGAPPAPASDSSDLPPRQVSSAKHLSIDNTYFQPRILAKTRIGQMPPGRVNAPQPASVSQAATDGYDQHEKPEAHTSTSSESARYRTSRLDPHADHLEDDALIASPKKSPEKVRSASHVITSTGRLEQPQDVTMSKIEMQSSKKGFKRLTCYYWKQRGGCRYRDDECQYAHYETGMDEGKNTTCFWWWSFGHCKKSERVCLYAHRDTGTYAKPPPGYVPQKRPYVPPHSLDRFTKNGRADHYSPLPSPEQMQSPTEDLPTRRSPPLRPLALSSGIPESSPDRPIRTNADGAVGNKADHRLITADPRLARRPSAMSGVDDEKVLTASKADMNISHTTGPDDLVSPGPEVTPATEPSSSFNKCERCDKKVFGSASLCFMCKSTQLAISKDVAISSPFGSERRMVDTVVTLEVESQQASDLMPPTSPDRPARVASNPLKRVNSLVEPGIDTSMFIKKKARIFKPSEPRRTSIETTSPEMDSLALTDKSGLPPHPNVAVEAIPPKPLVALDDLIELERLRKQVALLEKSNMEERRAHKDAERLCAKEKGRADRLSEELEALKIRNQEMVKFHEEEQKKGAAQVTHRRNEQNHDIEGDATRTPRQARRAMTHANHIRRQSSNDFGVSNPNTSSPVRPRAIQTDKDERKLLHDMRERGIVFESDGESDDGPEVPPPIPLKPPKDPLWHPAKSSRDLFQVAPQYRQPISFLDLEAKKKEIAARPSRKQTFGKVLELSARARGTARVHREVDRDLPSRMIRTRVADGSGDLDPFNELEQTKEVEMTCEEFFGVPENALLCLTTTQQLAYRDGALDRWGKLPRVPDDEKFEIGG